MNRYEMSRASMTAAILIAGALAVGCDGKDPGDILLGGFDDDQMTLTIADHCSDGLGMHFRMFDRDNNLIYPNSSQVFVIGPGGSSTQTINCDPGARICYGAVTNPPNGSHWGIGIDGNFGCDNCCFTCNGQSVSRNLRC